MLYPRRTKGKLGKKEQRISEMEKKRRNGGQEAWMLHSKKDGAEKSHELKGCIPEAPPGHPEKYKGEYRTASVVLVMGVCSSYLAPNYISPTSKPYPYYVRKHNPLVIYDAISQDPQRVKRIRSFNDFANDVVNGTLPQWVFVTPNMVNDAHDTTIDFAASFLEYWLLPLFTDPRVNDDETLILLTFDETETYTIQNNVFAVALGGAIPLKLRGTTDDTMYTHYSTLSTVQANWGLKSLGRQDTNTYWPWVGLLKW
ncbi:phosphoesterase family-domain-containing protein [Mycena leptocephala]|nr:phosphoesterase family-domain-containing protein [Mycena leptocephala]